MLSDAVAASPGGADPVIDGEPVDHLTMIGKIRCPQAARGHIARPPTRSTGTMSTQLPPRPKARRSIQPAANFLELRLDDGSGILVVRQWREEEDEAANAQTANLRMGDYVRVYGSLRNLDESQCVQVRQSPRLPCPCPSAFFRGGALVLWCHYLGRRAPPVPRLPLRDKVCGGSRETTTSV